MKPNSERFDAFGMAVAVEGGLALVALALAWLFGVSLREQFAPVGMPLVAAIARGVLSTLPMLVVFWCVMNLNWSPFQVLRNQVEWVVREVFPDDSLPQFAMVAVLAGVGEELLFRGVLQTKLATWTTPIIGILLASVLFGFAHALSKLYFAIATGVGVFLGWLAYAYHDLYAPVVAHALYDFLALVYVSRRVISRSNSADATIDADALEPRKILPDERPHH